VWNNPITRRSFLKRTGGATVAALVAWQVVQSRAAAEGPSDEVSASKTMHGAAPNDVLTMTKNADGVIAISEGPPLKKICIVLIVRSDVRNGNPIPGVSSAGGMQTWVTGEIVEVPDGGGLQQVIASIVPKMPNNEVMKELISSYKVVGDRIQGSCEDDERRLQQSTTEHEVPGKGTLVLTINKVEQFQDGVKVDAKLEFKPSDGSPWDAKTVVLSDFRSQITLDQ